MPSFWRDSFGGSAGKYPNEKASSRLEHRARRRPVPLSRSFPGESAPAGRRSRRDASSPPPETSAAARRPSLLRPADQTSSRPARRRKLRPRGIGGELADELFGH